VVNHKLLGLSATLLFIGLVLSTILTQYVHPGGDATTYKGVFASYAVSENYAAIHLAEFVSEAVLLAGLLVLYFALNVSEGTPRWLGFFGAIATGVALALSAVLSAVDGVALKQAVDAWASAPMAEQATRFASVEAIRWLEWGTNSYWNIMQGLAVVLYALVIVWTARVPRLIGYLMGLSGLGFIVLGWFVGTEGFRGTPTHAVPTDVGYGLLFVSTIWLLIVAWRGQEAVQAAPA
jgi:hypothetical protein